MQQGELIRALGGHDLATVRRGFEAVCAERGLRTSWRLLGGGRDENLHTHRGYTVYLLSGAKLKTSFLEVGSDMYVVGDTRLGWRHRRARRTEAVTSFYALADELQRRLAPAPAESATPERESKKQIRANRKR